jgi:uncharacterized protein
LEIFFAHTSDFVINAVISVIETVFLKIMQNIKYQLVHFLFVIFLGFLSALSFAAEGDVDEKTKELKFYTAAKEGRLPEVKAMLSAGMNANAKNTVGRTALMGAAYYGNKSIVKELIVEGVDVNLADEQGKTALMLAVGNQRLDIIELLLQAGADITIADKKDKTAASIAEKINNKKLTKLLAAYE